MSHPAYAPKKRNTASMIPQSVYQVDYVAVNCGKIIASSKRRIRFKFGYTNMNALSEGKTGHACRGSEHEVIITWSLSSGKQAIAFDQQEVFFDVGESTQSKITHCWKDLLGHTLEVKAHAASMSTKANPDPNWKQYDLIIDGVSFFRIPKIFEIGNRGNVPDSFKLAPKFAQCTSKITRRTPFTEVGNESNKNTEAIFPPDCSKPQPEPVKVADLLSFDEFEDSSPTFADPPQQPPAHVRSQPTISPDQSNYAPGFQAPACATFAPEEIQQFYPAYQPTPGQPQSNNVSPIVRPGDVGNVTMAVGNDVAASYMQQNSHVRDDLVAPSSEPNPVTPTSTSTELAPEEPAPSPGFDGAMANLVNIDDLFCVSKATLATKESVDAKMQQENAHKSLGQFQGCKSHTKGGTPIMNAFEPPVAHYQQQGMCNGAANHQQQQVQYNNYGYQQTFTQCPQGYGY
ncbi:hypothetical protein ACHAWF_008349 [Thalassiosira exigua]